VDYLYGIQGLCTKHGFYLLIWLEVMLEVMLGKHGTFLRFLDLVHSSSALCLPYTWCTINMSENKIGLSVKFFAMFHC